MASPARAAAEEPTLLSRLERLDTMMGYLEEMRGSRGASSPTTTSASTGGSGNASAESSPRTSGACRRARVWSVGEALAEAKEKGSLIERVGCLEARLLRLEGEAVAAGKKSGSPSSGKLGSRSKKAMKGLVRSCVGAGGDAKAKD